MGCKTHPDKSRGRQGGARTKLAAVVETSALNEAELAGYCRARGLYPEEVKTWRTQAEAAMAGGLVPAKALRDAVAIEKKRVKELEHELHRKEKALAETAALLILRKKCMVRPSLASARSKMVQNRSHQCIRPLDESNCLRAPVGIRADSSS